MQKITTHIASLCTLCLMTLSCAGGSSDHNATAPSDTTTHTTAVEIEIKDLTPEEFRTAHPDEWQIVYTINAEGQRNADNFLLIDFSEVDSLIMKYAAERNISFPSDPLGKIEAINELCQDSFDIRQYDQSNDGMCASDFSSRLFDYYQLWLYEQEVRQVQANLNIDIDKEKQLLEDFSAATIACYDSIGQSFAGNTGWIGRSEQDYAKRHFWKTTLLQILVPEDQKIIAPISIDMFRRECGMVVEFFEPTDELDDARPLANAYLSAFHKWYKYRFSGGHKILDTKVSASYIALTNQYVRSHFIHLKNRFKDIGANCIDEIILRLDCSDDEMYRYSYEHEVNKL